MGNLKDYATSTILTPPSPATSGTTIVLQAGHGARFPAVPFMVTVHPPTELPTLDNAEKLEVTAKSTDTLTVLRAQGDTTTKVIEAGWRISNTLFNDDVVDIPSSTTNNGIVTWSGTAGTAIQDSTKLLPTGTVVGTSDTQTLTDKTIAIGSNTITGTTAQFNTANTDADFYTTGGTDVSVADGGTGRSTGTTAYSLVATGTTATGAQQTLANGATTEVLVGGGASALPVWTTATGSGAPVRATSPTLTTPVISTITNTGTLTLPTSTDTLVGRATTDTLTNKTLTQSSWSNITLLNSWVNYETSAVTYPNAQYFKDSMGIVHLRGLIKSGTTTTGTSIGVLPSGFRPEFRQHFAASTNSAYCTIRVDEDGNIRLTGATTTWVALDSVNFRAV